MIETIHCLYCQTKNTVEQDIRISQNKEIQLCQHCGMALPNSHPESISHRTKLFCLAFVLIVLFCVVMVIYLPR